MPRVTPLCTVSELGEAFGLLMPRADAERWAREWFERFADADDVDPEGRFLYREWWSSGDEPQARISGCSGAEAASRALAQRLRAQSREELGESLMSFSSFHLSLLSLVSPQLAEKVRAIRNRTPEQAEEARAWMRQVLHQLTAEP